MTAALTLRWQLRESLIGYMLRDAGFEAELSGGAAFDPASGVALPARRDPDGTIRATGSATLRAHGGALSVPLREVIVAGGELWVTPATDESERLRLVTLSATETADVFDTALAPDADALFLYNYVPGTPFGFLRLDPPDRA